MSVPISEPSHESNSLDMSAPGPSALSRLDLLPTAIALPSHPLSVASGGPDGLPQSLPAGNDFDDDNPNGDDQDDPGCLNKLHTEPSDENHSEEPDELEDEPEATIEELRSLQQFIAALWNASLDDEKLDTEVLERLGNPLTTPVKDDLDHIFRFSLDVHIATTNASNKTYNDVIAATKRLTGESMLTLDQLECRIWKVTGIELICKDMCRDSCLVFVGHFKDNNHCRRCGLSRWDEAKLEASGGKIKVPVQTYDTIPIGPQLQALFWSPDSARSMHYRSKQTTQILEELERIQKTLDGGQLPEVPVFDDFLHGADYLAAVKDSHIKEDDLVLMMFIEVLSFISTSSRTAGYISRL